MLFTEQKSVIISVFSTVSGVGKTLTAINLAAGLAKDGYSVCLIDLDLQFGDVASYLDLDKELNIAVARQEMAFGPEYFYMDNYLNQYEHGDVSFSVLLPPVEVDEAYRIEVPMVEWLLSQLNRFEFIVLDLTSNFNALNLAMLDTSTLVTYLGSTESLSAIKNYKVGYDTLRRFNYDRSKIRLVGNNNVPKGVVGTHNVERLLGENFYHKLPYNAKAVRQSIKEHCPLVLSEKKSDLGDSFWQLAGLYTGRQEAEEQEKKSGPASFLKKLYQKFA